MEVNVLSHFWVRQIFESRSLSSFASVSPSLHENTVSRNYSIATKFLHPWRKSLKLMKLAVWNRYFHKQFTNTRVFRCTKHFLTAYGAKHAERISQSDTDSFRIQRQFILSRSRREQLASERHSCASVFSPFGTVGHTKWENRSDRCNQSAVQSQYARAIATRDWHACQTRAPIAIGFFSTKTHWRNTLEHTLSKKQLYICLVRLDCEHDS